MKISLVTISFNQGEYLPSLFASIQEQIGPEDEHIVVDPGSTDGSRDFIVQQAVRDRRLKVVFEKDRGPADGLNKGFAAAGGDVLAYINADDWLLPGALNYVRRHFATQAATDVLIGAIKIADEAGRLRGRGRVADRPTLSRLATGVCQYYQQGTFFRRSAFQRTTGFNSDNRTCWDREMIVDLAISGARFHITSRPLGVFRIHGQSITGSGLNSASYAADSARIQRNAEQALGFRISPPMAKWLRLEGRINPVRWLRQLHPAPRS